MHTADAVIIEMLDGLKHLSHAIEEDSERWDKTSQHPSQRIGLEPRVPFTQFHSELFTIRTASALSSAGARRGPPIPTLSDLPVLVEVGIESQTVRRNGTV
jgi:hypothetical protein